jgi:hypothetical protein
MLRSASTLEVTRGIVRFRNENVRAIVALGIEGRRITVRIAERDPVSTARSHVRRCFRGVDLVRTRLPGSLPQTNLANGDDMDLVASLRDWTDVDFAAHALARALGIMPPGSDMNDAKWVYWTENRLGNELIVLLDRLTELGFLERRDEELQYRVRSDFPQNLAIESVWEAS